MLLLVLAQGLYAGDDCQMLQLQAVHVLTAWTCMLQQLQCWHYL